MTVVQWGQLVQVVFGVLLTICAVWYARAKTEQVGRDELLKSLEELRSQVQDRDRTAIGLREQLSTVHSEVQGLSERVKVQETQILVLVRENIGLKKPPRKRSGPPKGKDGTR